MTTLHESGEDYLEAILMLQIERGSVRSVDIAARLGVTKASVSKAMANLEARGYVEMIKRDVRLTDAGREVAERMLERHEFFCSLLVAAGVEADRAAEEGCHMEHCLSDDSFHKLKSYLSDLSPR
ncbi:metal-dependent transcriptional regulator [Collinsella sp. An2]|uniref:metal-dependent transcriptional regulator n=1 Tax=Collinsella sp. An2 TaxID=1965585 RepID=UPI000B37E5F4|nr:metal-dependent transcriptional regulator [Collinsella sp. An2]OUP08945.1 DtxR family transcriptional regulator [Collinsella sp. An2]